ncbi:hypothetical protein PQR63_00120 [Herbaspirillum rhizosphaerae]|uniref:Zinc ribbon protein n=1 Tax=Herbaspirillum rhizosphaerae TaxID=346179 RepID=A0ABW8Z0M6_9BURK
MTDTTTAAKASAPLMSTIESLLQAASAFKNFRALTLLGLTFVTAVLTGGLFAYLASVTGIYFLFFLATLLSIIVLFYGSNGVGILLMNDAQGHPDSHSIIDAVLLSLYTSHRLLAVVFLQILIVLAVIVVVAIALAICKIPVLGPLLYTFVFPVSAVVLGILVFALYFVMLPLAAPAVWSGSSVFQVIAQLNMVVRKQLIMVLLSEFILMLITGFVAFIITMVIVSGSAITSSMSLGIIGFGGGGLLGLASGFGFGGMGGNGHMMAGMVGGGLLFAVGALIPSLIWSKGICLIYLNSTRDLDFSKAEEQLNSKLDSVRKKAEEARERARDLAAQQKQKAGANPVAATAGAVIDTQAPAVVAPSAPACPVCHAGISSDDVFCGNCGNKLK